MIRDDLRRCPFCGGRANLWKWNYGCRVDCENWKDGHFVGVEGETEAEAIELWQGGADGKERVDDIR